MERQSTEGALQVVGPEVVAVVDANDPYALPTPLDLTGVVYKKGNPVSLNESTISGQS